MPACVLPVKAERDSKGLSARLGTPSVRVWGERGALRPLHPHLRLLEWGDTCGEEAAKLGFLRC